MTDYYKHYRGGIVKEIAKEAHCTGDSEETVVVYEDSEGRIWARNYHEFHEFHEKGFKWEGEFQYKRFEKITEGFPWNDFEKAKLRAIFEKERNNLENEITLDHINTNALSGCGYSEAK